MKNEQAVGNINFGACHMVSDKYSNEYDFFINGFNMEVADDTFTPGTQCFNFATSSSPIFLFILASLIALL